ncbi:cyclic nucleotide-gated cation channel beta-1-like [Arachis ipaensis]|uniref:cyclic nucleotide-gated cation channel beta-1-like n=1 Tax=Arachis ipaensis TaxID=130454 RepID=UPI0007AFC10C|nr:cyclic nucleotide-gated cation channel beta-1-like [Arachis ipaensis]XP_025670063.1 cyclic nucleotide-gated cation channel beta-1-like [Arachis hypogaea]
MAKLTMKEKSQQFIEYKEGSRVSNREKAPHQTAEVETIIIEETNGEATDQGEEDKEKGKKVDKDLKEQKKDKDKIEDEEESQLQKNQKKWKRMAREAPLRITCQKTKEPEQNKKRKEEDTEMEDREMGGSSKRYQARSKNTQAEAAGQPCQIP